MTANAPPVAPLETELQQAIAEHQAGRYVEAEELYLSILQVQPYHAIANHNLGLLAGQVGQYEAGLPYLLKALSVEPDEGQFWLSYANGLLQAGQAAEALDIIETAISRGLDNEASQKLRLQIQSNIAAAALMPSQHEIDHIVALYHQGDYIQMETATLALLEKFPESAFGWSVLGTALEIQGKDALEALQKTVMLAPHDAEAHSNLGNAWQRRHAIDAAIDSYLRALEIHPHFVAAHCNLGTALMAQERLQDAEQSYRRALAIDPSHATAHFNLAEILKIGGKWEAAIESYRSGLALVSGNAPEHANMADLSLMLHHWEDAQEHYRVALNINSNNTKWLAGLGAALHGLKQHEASIDSYQAVLRIDSQDSSALINIGNILQKLERYQEAVDYYRQALAIEPDSAVALSNIGATLMHIQQLDEAESCQRAALEIHPEFAMAHNNLGGVLQRQGRHEEAAECFRRTIALAPEYAVGYKNLCGTLHKLRQYDAALEAADQALAYAPEDPANHFNKANILSRQERPESAKQSFLRAIELNPGYAEAHANLASVLHEQGDIEASIVASRRAIEIEPRMAFAHSNYLFSLSHSTKADAASLFAAHCAFGQQFEGDAAARHPHTNPADPDRCLRIGFVSGDFNNHAVANFFLPVLEQLTGYPQLALYAYYNNNIEDDLTLRLKRQMNTWRDILPMSDDEAEQLIRADGIDILIDLSGHSAANRLPLFGRKPAPLQASWMGYPGTTGLQSVDYYLSDSRRFPMGKYDGQFTEAIVRMPLSAPFLPAANAPEVNTLPALSNGFLTFGSFNRPSKLSHEVVTLWAKLLHALPDSRLLLGALGNAGENQQLLHWFEEEGIPLERLILQPRSTMHEYLTLHHQVDVCLNPFPYTGATTLLHAMWMGVPTLTTTGPTTPSHGGASFLGHVGLEAFVANDAEEFVRKGVFLANNLSALATIRADLRDRFERSPVGHPEVVAAGLERAFRIMWHRYCENLPPAPIQIGIRDIANVITEETHQ